MNEKTCTKCKTSKPLNHEHWYVHPQGGWHSRCKVCMLEISRAHYAKVKNGEHEPIRAQGLDYARINALAAANLERDKRIVREFRAELESGVYADVPASKIISEFQAELASGMYDE